MIEASKIRNLATDVRALAGLVDRLDRNDSVEMIAALDDLGRAVSDTLSYARHHLMGMLDAQPTEIGGRLWKKQMDGKWRADHGTLAQRVAEHATVDRQTGEVRDVRTAVREALRIMSDLYVSPSTVPKTGALEKMGILKKEIAEWEFTGYRIVVEDKQEKDEPREDPF